MRSILDSAVAESQKRASSLLAGARAVGPRRGGGGSIPGLDSGAGMLAVPPGQNAWHLREQVKHFRGWVFSAIRPIANRIAGQQVRVARLLKRPTSKSGGVTKDCGIPWSKRALLPQNLAKRFESEYGAEMIPSHPILDALDDPNSVMVRWAIFYVTVCSLEMNGKAFWWVKLKKERDARGRPLWEVWPVPAHWMTPVHTEKRLYDSWEIRPDGVSEPERIPHEEVVYFYYPDFTSPLGAFSTLQALAPAVSADEAIGEAQTRGFQNGVHPGVLLTVGRHPDVNNVPGQRPILTQAQRAQLIHLIKSHYRGVARWDEPMILDGLIENATKMSFSPAEMDYQASSKLTKEKITQGFGVSPVIMGQLENANRASSIVADEHFVNSTVNPKIELMSECMTAWLGPLFSPTGERIIVYIEPATTHDAELEMKKLLAAFDRGVIDVNFLRGALLNLGPTPGGNVRFVSKNMIPVLIDEAAAEPDVNPYVEAFANAAPSAPSAPADQGGTTNGGDNVIGGDQQGASNAA